MKKKIILGIAITIVVVAVIVVGLVVFFNRESVDPPDTPQTEDVLGVWWWNDDLGAEEYLSFAQQYGVNEVYYSSSEFGSKTRDFINKAKTKGMKVYYLQGEWQWLDDDTRLHEKIGKYKAYQEKYPNSQFSGIHLDIEPHQSPDFEVSRASLILKLIELANELKTMYSEISFDYDIPFWLDDNILFNDVSKPAYQHMIDIADRIFVMSYRDTAEKIKEKAIEELNYAKSLDKIIVLSVESSSSEGDNVSFLEEGRSVMIGELQKLKSELGDSIGLSIHHIKSFKDLKD